MSWGVQAVARDQAGDVRAVPELVVGVGRAHGLVTAEAITRELPGGDEVSQVAGDARVDAPRRRRPRRWRALLPSAVRADGHLAAAAARAAIEFSG